MLHTKYQGFIPNSKALGLVVSDKKTFSCFPYISLFKTSGLQGGPIVGPRGIIWKKNLLKVHYVVLHTKYQGSASCGFRRGDFFKFSQYKAM